MFSASWGDFYSWNGKSHKCALKVLTWFRSKPTGHSGFIQISNFISGESSCVLRYTVVKNLPANAGDAGGADWIPGSGRSPGGGNGNPLEHSCLKNSMDKRRLADYIWRVCKKSDTTKQLNTHTHTHTSLKIIHFPPMKLEKVQKIDRVHSCGWEKRSV